MSNKDEIKVSVCVVTYNQEKYIAECLQSLVDQETDFPFEIVVGEDCSTDRTRDIVEEFALKYPDLIVRNYQDKNVGPTKNTFSTYALARGKYIAHMDGDDYALPNKLKRQVELLEANPRCFISSHAVMKVDSNSKATGHFSGDKIKGIKDFSYLVANLPFFAHSSKMFRNINDFSYFDECQSLGEVFDFELHLIHARYGDIIHTNEVLGAYRVNVGIATTDVESGSRRLNKLMVKRKFQVYERLISSEDKNIPIDEVRKSFAKSALNYAIASFCNGDFKSYESYIKKSISIKKIGYKQIVFFAALYFPLFLKRKLSFFVNRVFAQ